MKDELTQTPDEQLRKKSLLRRLKFRLEFLWCQWVLLNPLLQRIQLFLIERVVTKIFTPLLKEGTTPPKKKPRDHKKKIHFLSLLWNGWAPHLFQDVEFRPVRSIEELLAASKLAYHAYIRQRLMNPNKNEMRLTFHQLLPHTTTFIILYRRRHVLGTVTLVEDSLFGLPTDKAYKRELDQLRKKKRQLIEATQLAFDNQRLNALYTPSQRLILLVRFFKTILDFVQSCTPVDEMVACFHPRHRFLYEFLEWKHLGELKPYAAAKGNPAIAKHFNIPEVRKKAKKHIAYRFFFGNIKPPEEFENRFHLTQKDFETLMELEPHLLDTVKASDLKFLQSTYPSLVLPAPLQERVFIASLKKPKTHFNLIEPK